MRTIVLIFFLFSFAFSSQAQKEETLFNQYGVRLSGVWGGWTTDNSFISDGNAFNNGGFVTFEFSKDLTFEIEWTGFSNDIPLSDTRILDKANFRTFLLGYNPKSHKVIHPTFRLGLGRGSYSTFSETDNSFVLEPRIGIEVNVFQWARLQLHGGAKFPTSSSITGVEPGDLSMYYLGGSLKFGVSWGSANSSSDSNTKEFEF